MKKIINYLSALIGVVLLVIIDRATKLAAVNSLSDGSEISLIDNVFSLYYVENRGAAFGIMNGRQILLYIITIAIIVFVIVFYIKIPKTKRFFALRAVMVLIISGALGNLYDRVIQHYVIDFMYFKAINFPVFNVADIYITVGAVILIILLLFYYKDTDLKMIFKKKNEN